MSNPQSPNTNEESYLINELITRYKQRLKTVFKLPNPYIKPLWEKSEIEQKIKQLEQKNKKA